MLRERIVTAAVLIGILLALLYAAPLQAWAVFCVIATTVAAHEWGRLSGLTAAQRPAFAAAIGVLVSSILLFFSESGQFAVLAIGVIYWCTVAPFWLRRRDAMRGKLRLMASGTAILSATCISLVTLRGIGADVLLGTMGIIWVSDTAAYFSGKTFGKHKLAPQISPGKSWEGVAGAILAVVMYSCAWLIFFPQSLPQWLLQLPAGTLVVVVLWIGLALLGVEGDLIESQLKRMAGVKDSGNILPGHGGILDRVDALTASLPLAACLYIAK